MEKINPFSVFLCSTLLGMDKGFQEASDGISLSEKTEFNFLPIKKTLSEKTEKVNPSLGFQQFPSKKSST